MKTILNVLGILLFAYTLQSCSFNTIRGNGTIIEKEIAIDDYSSIDFSGGASIVYEQKISEAPYFKIEIDENIYPLLIIETKNGKLSIRNKDNINPTKYNIYTNSTTLNKLSASGSINAHLKNKLVTDEMNVHASGSVKVQADDLECNTFKSNISGSGDINLAGKANQVHCSISGSGKLKALPMITDSAYCKVSGSGNFEVYANKYLKVSISGSGSVRYKGQPHIDQSISGSGKVVRVD